MSCVGAQDVGGFFMSTASLFREVFARAHQAPALMPNGRLAAVAGGISGARAIVDEVKS